MEGQYSSKEQEVISKKYKNFKVFQTTTSNKNKSGKERKTNLKNKTQLPAATPYKIVK